MSIRSVLLVAALVSGNAIALDYLGVELEASEEAFSKANPEFQCRVPPTRFWPLGDRWCTARTPYGNAPATHSVNFYGDRMATISVRFERQYFSDILGGLKEKYGPPTREESRSLSNAMGATFSGAVVTWDFPGGWVQASERSSNLTESLVIIQAPWAKPEFERRTAEMAKRAAGRM